MVGLGGREGLNFRNITLGFLGENYVEAIPFSVSQIWFHVALSPDFRQTFKQPLQLYLFQLK